jgi:Zn-dependent M16 (insulinase) family peptidase
MKVYSKRNIHDTSVFKMRSEKTGLHVSLIKNKSPISRLRIVLRTEASNHDGIPHVLEHMIFMGSKDRPFKGMLDKAAQRSLSWGTNAGTYVNKTVYTFDCAGTDGFLRMVPLFTDCILFPELTDESFMTEVHHINKEGEDAGVVYCEMQSRENKSNELLYRTMLEELYSGTGYMYNTGGRVENLRSLCIDDVRAYHKKYYNPKNMLIIVSGNMNPDDIMKSIQPIEEKLMSLCIPYENPMAWSSPIPPLKTSITKLVEYPSTGDDTNCIVSMSWRLCDVFDYETQGKFDILLEYLTKSPNGPLYKKLVDDKNSLCGGVKFYGTDYKERSTFIWFTSVSPENIDKIENVCLECMHSVIQEGIDSGIIDDLIHQTILHYKSSMENNPTLTIISNFILDFMGSYDDDESRSIDFDINTLSKLKQKPSSFWTDCIKEKFIESTHCTILSKPSKALGEKNMIYEKDRVTKQREMLGDEKLGQLNDALNQAQEKNETPVPKQLIDQFPFASMDGIKVFQSKTQRSESRVTVQYNHVPSQSFVHLYVYFDLSNVPLEQLEILSVFESMHFKLPVNRDGCIIDNDTFIQELDHELISYSSGSSCISEVEYLHMHAESSNYIGMIRLMKDAMFNGVITKEKINSALEKQKKRWKNSINRSEPYLRLGNDLQCLKVGANSTVFNYVNQLHVINQLLDQMKENPDSMIAKFYELRSTLFHGSRLRVHVIGNLDTLENYEKPWNDDTFISYQSKTRPLYNPRDSLKDDFLSNNQVMKSPIFGLASTDSEYLRLCNPGCELLHSRNREKLAVLCSYLCAKEGPLWNAIRGGGYAYHFSMYPQFSGNINFKISRSSDIVSAYKKSLEIITKYADGTIEFDDELLHESKSKLLLTTVSRNKDYNSAARQKFRSYIIGDADDGITLYQHVVNKVTIDDLKDTFKKYIIPLFDPKTSVITVVSNPSRVVHIQKELGRPLEHVEIHEYVNRLNDKS